MSNRSTNDNYIYKYKHTEISTLQVKVHIDHYKVSFTKFYLVQTKASLGKRLSS